MLGNVFAVRQADDGVDTVLLRDLWIGLYRVDDGCRISESGGLEKNGVEFFTLCCELSESPDEVPANGAANTAIVHGDQIFRRVEGFGH